MSNSIYQVNKGINKSIEFRGLRAQYIWYFGGMVMLLLVIFAVLYLAGAGAVSCLAITGGSGTGLGIKIFAMSRTYGQHGLMKAIARRRVPRVLKSYGRTLFEHFLT